MRTEGCYQGTNISKEFRALSIKGYLLAAREAVSCLSKDFSACPRSEILGQEPEMEGLDILLQQQDLLCTPAIPGNSKVQSDFSGSCFCSTSTTLRDVSAKVPGGENIYEPSFQQTFICLG